MRIQGSIPFEDLNAMNDLAIVLVARLSKMRRERSDIWNAEPISDSINIPSYEVTQLTRNMNKLYLAQQGKNRSFAYGIEPEISTVIDISFPNTKQIDDETYPAVVRDFAKRFYEIARLGGSRTESLKGCEKAIMAIAKTHGAQLKESVLKEQLEALYEHVATQVRQPVPDDRPNFVVDDTVGHLMRMLTAQNIKIVDIGTLEKQLMPIAEELVFATEHHKAEQLDLPWPTVQEAVSEIRQPVTLSLSHTDRVDAHVADLASFARLV